MAAHYKEEFPDYDDVLIIPDKFIDSSWHNDICPSVYYRWINRTDTCVECRIFQDYRNPELRERYDGKRYLFQITVNDITIILKESDDWDIIQELIDMLIIF